MLVLLDTTTAPPLPQPEKTSPNQQPSKCFKKKASKAYLCYYLLQLLLLFCFSVVIFLEAVADL